jgi:hypothetical protein
VFSAPRKSGDLLCDRLPYRWAMPLCEPTVSGARRKGQHRVTVTGEALWTSPKDFNAPTTLPIIRCQVRCSSIPCHTSSTTSRCIAAPLSTRRSRRRGETGVDQMRRGGSIPTRSSRRILVLDGSTGTGDGVGVLANHCKEPLRPEVADIGNALALPKSCAILELMRTHNNCVNLAPWLLSGL